MTQPIDETPAEPQETPKVERYLWIFITAAVVLSVAILVLSWRAGTLTWGAPRPPTATRADEGAGAGIPGSGYALRVVTADRLSVRSESRPDAPVIDEIERGQLVRIRPDGGDWVPAVRDDGEIIGWLEATGLGPADQSVAAVGSGRTVLSADVERLSGGVAGQLPDDLPRVTIRLFEDVEEGAPVGSVVYWYETGACTYALELLERATDLMKTAQVPESSDCDPLGELWFVDGETAMTAIWHRPDGSQWFTSYLKLD